MKGTFLTLGPAGFGAYTFENGRLTPSSDQPEGILTPGFVDVHIHGAFGYDFMEGSAPGLLGMLNRLAEVGYEALLPTTVTASPTDVLRALASLPEHPMVPGFHLEGPFISPKFPGAQPPQFIIESPVGASEWDAILDDPRLRLITLAPETPNALELTRRLSARGVRVSMGHTAATYAEANAGAEAGVHHATHTYNAMKGLHHREAGALGFVMNDARIDAEIIYDRLHVSPPAASILFKAKGPDQVIAVSDSTLAAGTPAGTEVTMWGLRAIVGDQEVRLPDGTLAGSGITLLDAFQNLWADFGAETAIRACSHNPRRILGIEAVRVWVLFGLDQQLREVYAVA